MKVLVVNLLYLITILCNFESLTSIFDNPEVSLSYTTVPYCNDEVDVTFYNSSSHETDSISWEWRFSDFIDSTNYNYSGDMDSTGTYSLELFITDSRGCTDIFIDDEIHIQELDVIVEIPKLDYVTWSDSGVVIVWNEIQDDNFEYLQILNQSDNMTDWLSAAIIDTLVPNYFIHEIGSPGLSQSTFVNNYKLAQVDSCGYQSDTSIIHSTILLETNSEDFQENEVSWTRYRGWDYKIEDQMIVSDTVNIIYELYRSENNIDFERIISVIDTLPYLNGSFTYIDKNLCNIDYTYYVLAINSEVESFVSRSNKSIQQPNFIDFTQPLNLKYATVNNFESVIVNNVIQDNYVFMKWDELDQSEMNYYKIDRYDNFYGWQEDYRNVNDSICVDYNADVYNDEYLYRISYWDECGNVGPHSNLGSNILLNGAQNTHYYDIYWNPYVEWEQGVKNYIVEYYKSPDNIWVELDIVSGTTLEYRDSDLQKNDLSDYDILHGVDTSYCYRVRAISYMGYESQSNEYCFIAEPTNYFPNAFSPNNDGINDYFEYKFRVPLVDDFNEYENSSFVKSLNLKIFNRWGNMVFETSDLDFKWDGTHRGEESPQGAYVVKYELTGFNGTIISDTDIIYLLR